MPAVYLCPGSSPKPNLTPTRPTHSAGWPRDGIGLMSIPRRPIVYMVKMATEATNHTPPGIERKNFGIFLLFQFAPTPSRALAGFALGPVENVLPVQPAPAWVVKPRNSVNFGAGFSPPRCIGGRYSGGRRSPWPVPARAPGHRSIYPSVVLPAESVVAPALSVEKGMPSSSQPETQPKKSPGLFTNK